MSPENVEIVRGIYDEWGRGNLRAGGDVYDESILIVAEEITEAGDSVVVGARQAGKGKHSAIPSDHRYYMVWSSAAGR